MRLKCVLHVSSEKDSTDSNAEDVTDPVLLMVEDLLSLYHKDTIVKKEKQRLTLLRELTRIDSVVSIARANQADLSQYRLATVIFMEAATLWANRGGREWDEVCVSSVSCMCLVYVSCTCLICVLHEVVAERDFLLSNIGPAFCPLRMYTQVHRGDSGYKGVFATSRLTEGSVLSAYCREGMNVKVRLVCVLSVSCVCLICVLHVSHLCRACLCICRSRCTNLTILHRREGRWYFGVA